MPGNDHNKPVSADALERKHESRNPPVGRMVFVAALVVAMIVCCFFTVRLMMGSFIRHRPLDRDAQARGIITAPNLDLLTRFPGPNLQANPHDDLVVLQALEEKELTSYGWLDRSNGIVRIPIERAMALLVRRGLPVRPTNAPAATGKSSYELIRERSQQR